jgi:DNA modification methylase
MRNQSARDARGRLPLNEIVCGNSLDVLKTFPDESIDCVVTSPPYWGLRDYGVEGYVWDASSGCNHEWGKEKKKVVNLQAGNPEFKRSWREQATSLEASQGAFCSICGAWRGSLGLEPTFDLYVNHLCIIFDQVKRVLKPSGTYWVNLGDSYGSSNGLQKSLCQIPSRFAIEMSNRGWIVRNKIIWQKPNCIPASVKDRFTMDFEEVFFFVKEKKYWFETQYESSIGSPNTQGRNKRCVWRISTRPFPEAHFAVYPPELITTPILAGCPPKGVVLDPFSGAGTTALVALQNQRNFVGIELNPEYVKMSNRRIKATVTAYAMDNGKEAA